MALPRYTNPHTYMIDDPATPPGAPEFRFARRNMSGSLFLDVNLAGAGFENVSLQGASFRDVNLQQGAIHDVDLRNAAFTDCNLDGATIDGVPFSELIAAYRAVNSGK